MATKTAAPVHKSPVKERAQSDAEKTVSSVLKEIENSSAESKALLRDVHISEVRDFEIPIKGKTRKVVVVVVPFPALKGIHKAHKKLVSELEKKLKTTVLVMAKRTIESKWLKKHRSQMRPRSRTLTSVHENLLEDLLTPGTIIAKRTRIRVDGSRLIKVTLDSNDKEFLEDKVDLIQGVYKRLTTKDIAIDFKSDPVYYTFRK